MPSTVVKAVLVYHLSTMLRKPRLPLEHAWQASAEKQQERQTAARRRLEISAPVSRDVMYFDAVCSAKKGLLCILKEQKIERRKFQAPWTRTAGTRKNIICDLWRHADVYRPWVCGAKFRNKILSSNILNKQPVTAISTKMVLQLCFINTTLSGVSLLCRFDS